MPAAMMGKGYYLQAVTKVDEDDVVRKVLNRQAPDSTIRHCRGRDCRSEEMIRFVEGSCALPLRIDQQRAPPGTQLPRGQQYSEVSTPKDFSFDAVENRPPVGAFQLTSFSLCDATLNF